MSALPVFLAIFIALFGAIFLGSWIRSKLSEQHQAPETKDTVRQAMALVSTMSALLLGLLVSAASGTYNDATKIVDDMSAKIVNLDSTLELYGPEAAQARADLRTATQDVVNHIWAAQGNLPSRLGPRIKTGDQAYTSLMKLAPKDEMQTSLKAEALRNMYDAFAISSALYTKSTPSISPFLLAVVVGWLAIIFISYSVFAPRNAMSLAAMGLSALAVFGALVMIWELDRPFDGLMAVSSEPMRIAIAGVGDPIPSKSP